MKPSLTRNQQNKLLKRLAEKRSERDALQDGQQRWPCQYCSKVCKSQHGLKTHVRFLHPVTSRLDSQAHIDDEDQDQEHTSAGSEGLEDEGDIGMGSQDPQDALYVTTDEDKDDVPHDEGSCR